MKKILIVFFSSALLFLTACGDSKKTSIDGAFGVEFGSDINSVKSQLNTWNEEYSGELSTNDPPKPNLHLNKYAFTFYGQPMLFRISGTGIFDDDNESFAAFNDITKDLINEYGEPSSKSDEKEDLEYLTQIKLYEWAVGSDKIDLAIYQEKDRSKSSVTITYLSNKVLEQIEINQKNK